MIRHLALTTVSFFPRQWWRWAASFGSAWLLYAVHPDLNLGWLAGVALLPLLLAIAGLPGRQAAMLGWWCGMLAMTGGVSWLHETMTRFGDLSWLLASGALLALGSFLGLYVAAFSGFVSCCRSRLGLPMWASGPAAWMALELLRESPLGLGGFPWLSLGYSQWNLPQTLPLASVVGVYGVGGWLVLLNCLLAETLLAGRSRRAAWSGAALVGAVLLGVSPWLLRPSGERTAPQASLSVALAQGNIPQEIKWNSTFRETILGTYLDLTREAQQDGAQLVIWPEAALPFRFAPGAVFTRQLQRELREIGLPVLFGATTGKGEEVYNAAVFLDANGSYLPRTGEPPAGLEPRPFYAKDRLVPFGEYVPLSSVFFFVEPFVYEPPNFRRGADPRPFEFGGVRWGVNVCYEITFPGIIRRHVNAGAQVVVNVTNEAWFGTSPATRQTLAMAVLRAVENGVPVLRCANTGISALIEADGSIRGHTGLEETALLLVSVEPGQGSTWYRVLGESVAWLGVLWCGALLLVGARRVR